MKIYQAEKEKLSMPAAYGLGLAFKPSDRLIFDFDLYRMEWDHFVLTDSSGQKINPVTGQLKDQSPLKPTHHLRCGGEYAWLLKKMIISPRLGFFYDPEPADRRPDDFYGFGLGLRFGLSIPDH